MVALRGQENEIRITAQLNRTNDGYHSVVAFLRDGERYCLYLLGIQEEVATSITDCDSADKGRELRRKIRAATSNPEAHDLYLQGEYQFNSAYAGGL